MVLNNTFLYILTFNHPYLRVLSLILPKYLSFKVRLCDGGLPGVPAAVRGRGGEAARVLAPLRDGQGQDQGQQHRTGE